MKSRIWKATGVAVIAALMAACGGSSNDDPAAPPAAGPGPAPAPATKFSRNAAWTFPLPAAASICYDFDAATEVAGCTGAAWDLMVKNDGRSTTLWTNSGVSGSGKGGAFGGPFDRRWSELATWSDATVDPVDGAMPDAVYFKDAAAGVFAGTNPIGVAAFEYGVAGDHLFYPNYRVFLITTDSSSADAVGTGPAPVFALQITGYYGGAGGAASGHPTFRWVDRAAPGAIREATVDASAAGTWVYFDLITGTESSETGTWHIAFNRYNVKLNGGESGTGNVAGFVGRPPAGFYDANGALVASRFTGAQPSETLADLTATDMAVPAGAAGWIEDSNDSALNADARGAFPKALDYGWYSYYPTVDAATEAGIVPPVAHVLAANPEGAALLKSGEGNSYARFHVTSISYADPAQVSSQQTWTIEFDVQPAQ